MNKCVGAIEEFEFLPLSPGKHLHLTIAVTGWLCSGKYSKYTFSANNSSFFIITLKPALLSLQNIKYIFLSNRVSSRGTFPVFLQVIQNPPETMLGTRQSVRDGKFFPFE